MLPSFHDIMLPMMETVRRIVTSTSYPPISCRVHYRRRLDTIVTSKLANPVMMQNGSIGRYVQSTMSGHELPDEVVARLHRQLRLADVLGTLFVGVQFAPSSGLP